MEFKQLQDMALFALVAECGSFTAAAQRVGLPKSSVSQRISQLEQTLGLRLLNRTTRQLNLTFAGERYLEHCQAMMSAAERADLALQRLRDNPSGRLRISTPAGLGATPWRGWRRIFSASTRTFRWRCRCPMPWWIWYRKASTPRCAPASRRILR